MTLAEANTYLHEWLRDIEAATGILARIVGIHSIRHIDGEVSIYFDISPPEAGECGVLYVSVDAADVAGVDPDAILAAVTRKVRYH